MIKEIIENHINVTENLVDNIDTIKKICDLTLKTIQNNNKILLCGNGGSASDASHIAAEFVGRFEDDRQPLSAISMNDNISSITAIANDYGFEQIFSRQIQTYGNKNDLLIAISTSGNSINVINAVKAAIEKKIAVVIFTGENAGKMNDFDCLKLKIKSKNVARIQEMHILVGHIICKYVEENFL